MKHVDRVLAPVFSVYSAFCPTVIAQKWFTLSLPFCVVLSVSLLASLTTASAHVVRSSYKYMIRPQLENCVQFWLPGLKMGYGRPGKGAEKGNRSDPRMVHLPSVEMLMHLRVFSLEERWLRGNVS